MAERCTTCGFDPALKPQPGVLVARYWRTNGHMMADVAKLGYLSGNVCDLTFGQGVFWKIYRPPHLLTCDSTNGFDFRETGFRHGEFFAVVFDPPYKLNGRSTETTDKRYGVHVPATPEGRLLLMAQGLAEACRISRRYVLMKVMDQVVSGHKVWQTRLFANMAEAKGWDQVDRFDFLRRPRPQPPGRPQQHAQGNYSSLLVFEVQK
jgi:hypothetical protein